MKNLLTLLILCVSWFSIPVLAGEADITIHPNCHSFYAGREHTFKFKCPEAVGKSMDWNIKSTGRTLAAGRQTVPKNGEVTIKFDFPKLAEEVIVTAELNCWIISKTDAPAPSKKELKRKLYFFNPNPFEGKKKELEKQQIGVWEASKQNSLTELLSELDLPFAKVASPEQFSGKTLLISGLNLNKAPGALEACLGLAEKGKKVIVMPEIAGKTLLPLAELNEIKLGKNELIKGNRHEAIGIRKKFDTENWNGQAINQKSLHLQPAGENIEFKIKDEPAGFTYCELRKGKGKVIFITWEIINEANASPTPVYWLREVLGSGF